MQGKSKSKPPLTRNQQLALAAATICFLIGWFHTGQGLANYRVLGTVYGGFVLATGLLLIMILAYNKAIQGSISALGFYILCALITFICNLNSFYPNYRSDALIREELRSHRTSLVALREAIKSKFQDTALNNLAISVRSKSEQLQAQYRLRGYGPLTEQLLKEIEKDLSRNLTRLRIGNSQADWDRNAEQYGTIIEKELRAKLSENRYLEKMEDIRHADEYYEVFSKKIDETLADKAELKRIPDYVEDLVKGYRDSCKKARVLAADEAKGTSPSTAKEANIDCDEQYSSPNIQLGSFSHTFKSVWATLTDGGTVAVLVISLFIDFLFPLALYVLVRRDQSTTTDTWWNVGGDSMRPESSR